MKTLNEMTQFERERLENMVARAIRTKRYMITLDRLTPLSDGTADLRVIYRGGFIYRLIIDDKSVLQVAREASGARGEV